MPFGPGDEDGGGAPDGGRQDGGDAGGPAADARPCPEAIVAEAQVNGGGSPVTVLVGDTVHFTAGASCVRAEPATLTWTLSPADGTLLTRDGSDFDFTVYSLVANQPYVVSLEVRDANDAFETVTFQAFTTVGFEHLDGTLTGDDLDTRGIDIGDGALWLGTLNHAWRMPLDEPGVFTDISDTWNGADKPMADLGDVHYEAGMNRIWIGSSDPTDRVWRGTIASQVFVILEYDTSTVFGDSATVFDIEAAPLGIYIGTSQGVTQALTGDIFAGVVRPETSHAVLTTSARAWSGGRKLWDLQDATVELSPWDVPDNNIRSLGPDLDGHVWIGSDTEGAVRIDGTSGANLATFTTADGLPSNSVRSVAAETSGPFAGDAWFATTAGIGRWKKDRNEMITLAGPAGLTGRLQGREIRFTAFGGARTIYQSTTNGLVYAHLP